MREAEHLGRLALRILRKIDSRLRSDLSCHGYRREAAATQMTPKKKLIAPTLLHCSLERARDAVSARLPYVRNLLGFLSIAALGFSNDPLG